MELDTWQIIGIIVLIKLIIIAAIVIHYRFRNHWQRHMFRAKVALAFIGIFAAIVFYLWPEALYSLLGWISSMVVTN